MDRGTIQLARGRASVNARGLGVKASWARLARRTVRGVGLASGRGVLGPHLRSEILAWDDRAL